MLKTTYHWMSFKEFVEQSSHPLVYEPATFGLRVTALCPFWLSWLSLHHGGRLFFLWNLESQLSYP